MKITDTARYLSLALDSLERVLMPEIVSPAARANAEIMREVLHELLKRERYTPGLLNEQLAEGELLLAAMQSLLGELSGGGELAGTSDTVALAGDFNSLANAHAALTERIACLARQLSSQRQAVADPAQDAYLSTLLHQAASWEAAYYNAQRQAGAAEAAGVPGPDGPLTEAAFEAFLRASHPAGESCSVSAFAPIPGGFGKQTYRATVSTGEGQPEHLIVRKSDPVPMIVHGCFCLDQEFDLLRNVFATGFPVAEPLFLGCQVPGIDADFYVMRALSGSVPSSFLGAASATIPESIVLHMAELLARLHTLELEAFSDFLRGHGQTAVFEDSVASCYRRCLAEWKAYYERVEHLPSPFLIHQFDWLERHVPCDTRRPVLVHGDFNIHNVLAEHGRITGVLDWECAMFGAPEQDLAYIRPIISRHIGWDRFVAHYRDAGGPAIDESSLDFYMAFSALRVSVIFNRGIRNLQRGLVRDIRYAVVEQGLTREFMNLALASTTGPA